jgi:hypothetical protein
MKKLSLFLLAFVALSLSAKADNMFYLGFGYPVVANDGGSDFSQYEDAEGFSKTSIPLAFELAYYIEVDDNLGVGPIVSNRLAVNMAQYQGMVGVPGAMVEEEITQGRLAAHTLIGASANYYVMDDLGKGFFGRADLGLGMAQYYSLASDNITANIGDNPDPNDISASDLTEDHSAIGLGLGLGIGYSLPMGESSAFDIALNYNLFPMTIEGEIPTANGETQTVTIYESASYVALLIGFKF